MCVFSVHDLTSDPPFIRMDLVSCRNVPIYFTAQQQVILIRNLHCSPLTRPACSCLAVRIGGQCRGLFEAIDPVVKPLTGAGPLQRGAPFTAAYVWRALPDRLVRPALPELKAERLQALVDAAGEMMLEAYGPTQLVDAGFAPLHFFGASRRYFRAASRACRLSVFALCIPSCVGELKALCYRMPAPRPCMAARPWCVS